MNNTKKVKNKKDYTRLKQMILRFIAALCIFTFTVFLTPNFEISSFYMLIFSSIFAVTLDYVISVIAGIHDLPFSRGIAGFLSYIIIIYITSYFLPGYTITLFSAFIAALIYGSFMTMLPNK